MSKFEIFFFSTPTEGHFSHYWKEAQRIGIKYSKFEKMWFEAYNEFAARIAHQNLSKHRYQLASVLIEKGETKKTRNVGRKVLNQGLKALGKEFGFKPKFLKEEK